MDSITNARLHHHGSANVPLTFLLWAIDVAGTLPQIPLERHRYFYRDRSQVITVWIAGL